MPLHTFGIIIITLQYIINSILAILAEPVTNAKIPKIDKLKPEVCAIEHNFVVSIYFTRSLVPLCEGSLVSAYWILTAAHCCLPNYKPSTLTAYIGTIPILIDDQIIHKYYSLKPVRNDIALMKLRTAVLESESIKYVKLPEPYIQTLVKIEDVCKTLTVFGIRETPETLSKHSSLSKLLPAFVNNINISGIVNTTSTTNTKNIKNAMKTKIKENIKDVRKTKNTTDAFGGTTTNITTEIPPEIVIVCSNMKILLNSVCSELLKYSLSNKMFCADTSGSEYQVSIRYTLSSLHHCGGSLLSKKWVLTAAHCCLTKYRIGYLSVYAGFSSTYKNGVRSLVIEQFVHESYTVKPVRNDIALMKLDRPIAEGPKIRYVKLPKPYKITHPEITEICPSSVILGWGDQYEKDAHGHPVEPKIRPHDEHLQCANIPAITNYECSMRILKSVPTSIFCAYRERKDACQGDSGGPVMCNGVQYGIVSTGIGCAHKNYPGLYTRVDMYIDFINEKGGDAVINRLSDILKVYIVINVAIIRFIV